jgi:hypothetical protein
MNGKPVFRLIIAGGRNFNDYPLLRDNCNILLSQKMNTHNVIIISGTCRGADLLGEQYARENNLPVYRFPANWKKYGKTAGYLRNRKMAEKADALVAFWDGKSRGTANMITLARGRQLQIRIIRY